MAKSFYSYMLAFLKEDSPRGLLARDMQYEQERSPINTEDLTKIATWEQMRSYLEFHRAWGGFIETAKLCWQDYSKTLDHA